MLHSAPHRVIFGLPRWQLLGPVIFAERLARQLARAGHEARILLTEAGSTLVREPTDDAIPPSGLPVDLLPAGPDDTWGQRWESLERYLEERAPCTYIMLHDWRNNIIAPRLSRRIRLIGLVQADSALEFDQANRLGEWWDAIVAVSDSIHFKLASGFPHLAPRMLTIPNAVPCLADMPAKDAGGPLRIAYSGELRPQQKRLDDMVAVARQLAERRIDFHLRFFGDGLYRHHLEDSARSLVERGYVSFAGCLASEQLLVELARQHVFLLTSEYEGLSIALLEAMSRGCVPVVSRLASQSMVIREGENALAADVGDIDAFARHVEALAADRALLARLAAGAFATIAEGGYREQDMLSSYLKLFDRIEQLRERRGFVRRRGPALAPPNSVGGVSILPGSLHNDLSYLKRVTPWPDRAAAGVAASRTTLLRPRPSSLKDHTVLVASTTGAISGVDVFAHHLVSGLRARGIDARLHGRRPAEGSRMPDLPFDERSPSFDSRDLPRRTRWKGMVEHLERLAPCIYVPNYDAAYSCVAPQLSDRVRVVGIAHSDDPWHYEHMCRIGGACDAVVGVSEAITTHLRGLAPGLAERLSTIPYGVALPDPEPCVDPAPTHHDQPSRLRIMYSGRVTCQQKRTNDLIGIARALESRGVDYDMAIVGDGELREHMERAAREQVQAGKVRFLGARSNEAALSLLAQAEALVLPSAFEGLSVSMLEAMARGVVPVVSDVRSGVPEAIVSGTNGFAVPVGRIDLFAERLEWLWRHPGERHRMADAARATVSARFRVETMIDRYVELMERVVSDPIARVRGPIVPPPRVLAANTWRAWAVRVASDPVASLRRVARRFGPRFG